MRVPIVIALVLAGAAALFLALSGSPPAEDLTGTATPSVAAPTAAAPVRSTPEHEQVSRASDPRPAERTEAAPVRQQTVVGDSIAAEGDWATAIEGEVVDPAGEPVAEAIVTLRDDNALGDAGNLLPFLIQAGAVDIEPETWTVATDAEGKFQFTGVAPGDNYAIGVEAEGFATLEVNLVSVSQGQTTEERIVLDEGFIVAGYVRDVANGVKLPGAELTLLPLNFAQFPEEDPQYQARLRRVETSDDGYYEFTNVAPDMYMLMARAEGFGTVSMNDVQVLRDRKKQRVIRDFNLEAGDLIAGQVFSRDGEPLEGVRVIAISLGGQKTSRGTAYSQPNGSFQIRGLVPGTYTVVGQLNGWQEGREQRVETGNASLRLELIRQGGVTGRVLTPEGQPLREFNVGLRMVNPHTSVPGRSMRNQQIKGSSDGSFSIGGVPPGEYVVEAKSGRYAPTKSERFKITLGELTNGVVVNMTYGGAITGRVVDSATGEPIKGALVETRDNTHTRGQLGGIFQFLVPRTTTEASARTDADGVFNLELLTPDVYQVEISHRDFYSVVQQDLRVLDSEEPTDAGTFELSPGANLTGTVYDASGRPLVGGKVSVTNNAAAVGLSYEAKTNAQGRYRINNIMPGTYQVHAQRPMSAGTNDPFIVVVDIQKSKTTVYLQEGREVVQDLDLGG
ncbi:MAG: carboxypeptidase-like regulatory domain-containing protein [Planctomycetota bacterium]